MAAHDLRSMQRQVGFIPQPRRQKKQVSEFKRARKQNERKKRKTKLSARFKF